MGKMGRATTEKEVGQDLIEPQTQSKDFRTVQEPEPFYFRQVGDYIKGQLIGESKIQYPYFKQKLYRIEVWEARQDGAVLPVPDGCIRDIPGYKWLQRLIKHCQLMHSIVRFVYIGRKKTSHGHCEYLFRAYKDTGTFKESEVEQNARERQKRKRKKHDGAGADAASSVR